MGEVDEENEAEEDEYCGADEGDVIAPEDEEAVRDEEGYYDEDEPEEDFGTPPAKLIVRELEVANKVINLIKAYPFWMAARLSRVSLTPIKARLRIRCSRESAKQIR